MNHYPNSLCRALAALLLAGSLTLANAAEERPPNIVFFFCDDLGYADLGCYGHPCAKTPVIDQLAAEGTRFEQHYVTGVTCNPNRTGLMTGLHPARFPKYAADFGFGERTTITELLKSKSAATRPAILANGTSGPSPLRSTGPTASMSSK